jgi:hypothetical protein
MLHIFRTQPNEDMILYLHHRTFLHSPMTHDSCIDKRPFCLSLLTKHKPQQPSPYPNQHAELKNCEATNLCPNRVIIHVLHCIPTNIFFTPAVMNMTPHYESRLHPPYLTAQMRTASCIIVKVTFCGAVSDDDVSSDGDHIRPDIFGRIVLKRPVPVLGCSGTAEDS